MEGARKVCSSRERLTTVESTDVGSSFLAARTHRWLSAVETVKRVCTRRLTTCLLFPLYSAIVVALAARWDVRFAAR